MLCVDIVTSYPSFEENVSALNKRHQNEWRAWHNQLIDEVDEQDCAPVVKEERAICRVEGGGCHLSNSHT